MIKINVKTVSAKDYQGIESKNCNITGRRYSDLSSNKNYKNWELINQRKKLHTCQPSKDYFYNIKKLTAISLHGEEEYKRILDLEQKLYS